MQKKYPDWKVLKLNYSKSNVNAINDLISRDISNCQEYVIKFYNLIKLIRYLVFEKSWNNTNQKMR